MYQTIQADQIKVGDIIAKTATNPMVSVKQVDIVTHPVFRTQEVKIRGSLGIIVKYPATAQVRMVRVG